MIIFNRKVDDKLKNKNTDEDILNMSKLILEIGKKDGIATTVMTAYGNFIDDKFKDNQIKKMLLLGKINELICKFILNE